jgi:UDP-N-acetylglucosamine 2-epimerase (non-hydrolysing)
MAEERIRRECDAFAALLCAPTERARENLCGEQAPGRTVVTGNTVVDEIQRQLARLPEPDLSPFGATPHRHALLTLHRRETVEDDTVLREVLDGIARVADHTGLPVIAPLHPRTRQRLADLDLQLGERIRAIPPVGYIEFLQLHRHAALVLTDSGGVQEEACILGIPCIILRETTERPEAVEVGAARIAGVRSGDILTAAQGLFGQREGWTNPFGDGQAWVRIAREIATCAAAAPHQLAPPD